MSTLLRGVIVALATPRGVGAISVVRASGADVLTLFEGLIVPFNSRDWRPSHARRVRLVDSDGIFDDAIAVFNAAPNSYTGEETLEISTHGNPLIVDRLLKSMVSRGASIAEPGEFTKRALLNGKIDVVAAEGVLAISEAMTDRGLKLARAGIDGRLRRWYDDLRKKMLEIAAELEARLDYPEDELALVSEDDLDTKLKQLSQESQNAAETYGVGDLILRGATVALIGVPNAGKSSIFNALLGRKRAVVHEKAGTTRDVVEASSIINGLRVSWLDTAGERDSLDPVEQAGLALAQTMLESADLLIVVIRASEQGLTSKEREILDRVNNESHLVVLNGVDVKNYTALPGAIETVAIKSQGVEELKKAVSQKLTQSVHKTKSIILASERQRAALQRIAIHLESASLELNQAGIAVAAFSVAQAIYELDQLTGLDGGGDMLKTLFSKFCIGK